MNHYPASIQQLIRSLSKFPGIGTKTAERLAMHILRAPRRDVEKLAHRIMEVKEKTRLCRLCFALSDGELCRLCSDPARDRSMICVVEQPADMVSIEKSGGWNGLYHILQGALSPIDGIGPEALRIKELMGRISAEKIKEIVLATGTSTEGESTASFLAQRLSNYSVKVSRIASGVPMGGDLKYIDQVTIRKAMDRRHGM
ncbi:MAG: recombination mediator RecR [Thermodesulfobacteriota bacterium]|nr:recombination mediator RecR [Thermodesulfobacteriota bacterium]